MHRVGLKTLPTDFFLLAQGHVQQHGTAVLLCPSPAAKVLCKCGKQLPKASFIVSHFLPEAKSHCGHAVAKGGGTCRAAC